MEVKMNTTAKSEQQEMDGINAKIHTLWEKGLLTEFDCRMIATSNTTLKEKKAAVYTAIMSKSKDEAAILTENFRKMTENILSREMSISLQNTTNNKNEANNYSILQSRNPLLIDPIILRLFGFLPLEDIKRSRLVCRGWNSTAEIILRKRSAVHFRHDVLLPRTFIEFSKYSLPQLPFPSFVFSSDEKDKNSSWQITEIEDFCAKYGENIKELTFRSITLTTKCNLTDRGSLILYYDVTPLFINPSNIASLKIKNPLYTDTHEYEQKTTFDISLEKFVSIKTLSLHCCRLMVSAENQSARIAPLSVDFVNVCLIQNGEIATQLRYNDVLDFSKASNINLDNPKKIDVKFDMDNQVFHVNQLSLANVDHENWSRAKGDVEFLYLKRNKFLERNNLKIRQLKTDCCYIDLSALPETLEILNCVEAAEISCSEEVYLPNLKSLCIPAVIIDSLAHFSHCSIVELEVTSHYHRFNLSLVPKTVKRLKMELTARFVFTDDSMFELDTLMLGVQINNSDLIHCKEITTRMKAKVLVIAYRSPNISPIVQLVLDNKQSEKNIVGLLYGIHHEISFEGSPLSNYVDKKSNYYQFENNFGKSITKAQFEEFARMKYYCSSDFLHY